MKLPVFVHVVLAVAGSWGLSRPVRAESPPPPPSDAATPLVEIYGTLVPFVEYGSTFGASRPGTMGATQVTAYSGARAPGRFVLDMGTSNLGFRGGVDITDDVAVIWQVESGVMADGTPVANTIASRNSQVGVAGKWGTLFAGSWDTPFKWATLSTVNPLRAGYISDYNGLLSGPGFGIATVVTQPGRVNAAADASFERRQGNSVQYWSPTYEGVSARLAYSLDEGRTPSTPMAPSIDPSIFSASLAYDKGPVKLRYAFEAHFDYFGMSQQGGSPGATNTNSSSTDFGHRVVASYTHAQPGFDTRVVGVFEFLSYKNDDTTSPTAVSEHSRAAYYGLVDQTLFGKNHVWFGFGQAADGSCALVGGGACSTNGLGASMGVLGYVYRFSKDMDFYAAGFRITNKASASYNTFTPLGGPAAPGSDVQGLGVGLVYQFSATIARGSHRVRHPTPAPPPAAPVPTQAPDVTPGPAPAADQPPTPVPAPAPAPTPATPAPPPPQP